MVPRSIVASAPASTMLFGEHSVLRGGTALAAAIDCRTHVSITPRKDKTIYLTSSFGQVLSSIEMPTFGPRLRFVEAAFRMYQKQLSFGADVEITSDIDPTVGLASSASVTVALVTALREWLLLPFDRQAILLDSLTIIRSVQGHGSGADAASIIYGGIVKYVMDPLLVTPLQSTLPLVLVYSGKKTPTADVIRYVNEQESKFPALFSSIFSSIEAVTIQAILAINDLPTLGQMMNHADSLLEALGVGTPKLSSLCWSLRKTPTIFGAKISGSGLGDSVVGLGTLSNQNKSSRHSMRTLPATISSSGVILHE